MMVIPFSHFRKPSFVTGADGALVVLNGQTVDIAEGSVKHYSSIDVNVGGTLRITGNTGLWTEIGCLGDCIINGTVIARAGYDGQATHSGGTFSKVSAFGLGNLSYTIAQANGGKGGNTNGGVQTVGIGGGGGGGPAAAGSAGGSFSNGATGASGYAGGTGGGLGNGGNSVNDGSGAYPIGGSGASGGGGGALSTGKISIAYGGGGAGGYKGHHGKGLVLFVEGSLSGTGSILCSGRTGFNGGAGVDFSGVGGGDGGEGGGGGSGAGGSGGQLITKYGALISMPSLSVSGGAAGTAGAGNGQAGFSGQAGNNGTSSTGII